MQNGCLIIVEWLNICLESITTVCGILTVLQVLSFAFQRLMIASELQGQEEAGCM